LVLSAVNDNWQRVELMYSVVYEYFKETVDSDFRNRIINKGNIFPYSVSKSQSMQKESSLVGMLMAWAVVAIESLINHALAEKIDDRNLAVKAINNPNKVLKELQLNFNPESKLGTKIMILDSEYDSEIVSLSEMISSMRNIIVHDKPYDYFEKEGDVETKDYKTSDEVDGNIYRYEDLKDFFINCDTIKKYIEKKVYMETIEIRDFSSLLTLKS